MTEDNIPSTDRKNSCYRVYCPDMLNRRQRILSQWKCSISCTNFFIMAISLSTSTHYWLFNWHQYVFQQTTRTFEFYLWLLFYGGMRSWYKIVFLWTGFVIIWSYLLLLLILYFELVGYKQLCRCCSNAKSHTNI